MRLIIRRNAKENNSASGSEKEELQAEEKGGLSISVRLALQPRTRYATEN